MIEYKNYLIKSEGTNYFVMNNNSRTEHKGKSILECFEYVDKMTLENNDTNNYNYDGQNYWIYALEN